MAGYKKRIKKKGGGMSSLEDRVKRETGPFKRKKANIEANKEVRKIPKKSAKTSTLKNTGKITTPKKNLLSKKDGTAVRTKTGKTIGVKGNKLPKKVGSLFRSNKMGGGMMKKRMKRGGRAK